MIPCVRLVRNLVWWRGVVETIENVFDSSVKLKTSVEKRQNIAIWGPIDVVLDPEDEKFDTILTTENILYQTSFCWKVTLQFKKQPSWRVS